MNIKLDKYTPLMMYLSPASIPQIVAHIQDYLVKHPILSVETIAEIIVQSLQEHPELINGEAIPISADSAQSIKAYIDALPALDTYTKAEINALLLGKQDTLTFDQAPTPGSSNPVTSSGIIAALSALQATLETLINAKADSSTTYTKTQVDTLLEDKADADDVYSKNTMDAKLLEVNTDIDNLEDALSDQSQQIDTLGDEIDDLGPINNLTSESTTAALSAAQGKALNDKLTTVESFSISRGSAISTGTLDNNQCVKSGNVVNISGRIFGMSNQPADGVFFMIHEGYRPKMNTIVQAFIWADNDIKYPVFGTVYTNGAIQISLSSRIMAATVMFATSYAI